MSAFFRKVSWPYKVERYDRLREQAKKIGLKLEVKNVSDRFTPTFVFNVKEKGRVAFYSYELDDIEGFLSGAAP